MIQGNVGKGLGLRRKLLWRVLLLAGCVCGLSGNGFAQFPGLQLEITEPNALTETLEQIIEKVRQKMDLNGDGWLQLDEAPEHIKAMFGMMDVNRDGTIDATDVQAHQKRTGLFPDIKLEDPEVIWRTMLTPMIASMQILDKNGDMKIELHEVLPIHRSMFGFFDLNNDGAIDARDVEVEVTLSVPKTDEPTGLDPMTIIQDVEFLNQWMRNILDTDRNGSINGGELPEEALHLRGLFDLNFDGQLDQSDVGAWQELFVNIEDRIDNADATSRDLWQMMVMQVDTNGNGAIDREEMPAELQWLFELIDVNRDNQLSNADINEARAQMRRAGEQMHDELHAMGENLRRDVRAMEEEIRVQVEQTNRELRRELRRTRRELERTRQEWQRELDKVRAEVEAKLREDNERMRNEFADMIDRLADKIEQKADSN